MSVLADIAAAFRLLSRVPMPGEEGRRPLGWFGFVGLAFGAVGAGIAIGAVRFGLVSDVESLLVAVLVVGAWGALSGFMHWDGLADTADGAGVRGDAARRLAVMRDSTVGAYGVAAIALVMLLEVVAVATLVSRASFWPLIVAPVAGRAAAGLALVFLRAARSDGLGARYASGRAPGVVVMLTLPSIGVFAARPGIAHAACLAVATGIVLVVTRWSARLLGGITGDVSGALVLAVEVGVLATAAIGGAA